MASLCKLALFICPAIVHAVRSAGLPPGTDYEFECRQVMWGTATNDITGAGLPCTCRYDYILQGPGCGDSLGARYFEFDLAQQWGKYGCQCEQVKDKQPDACGDAVDGASMAGNGMCKCDPVPRGMWRPEPDSGFKNTWLKGDSQACHLYRANATWPLSSVQGQGCRCEDLQCSDVVRDAVFLPKGEQREGYRKETFPKTDNVDCRCPEIWMKDNNILTVPESIDVGEFIGGGSYNEEPAFNMEDYWKKGCFSPTCSCD